MNGILVLTLANKRLCARQSREQLRITAVANSFFHEMLNDDKIHFNSNAKYDESKYEIMIYNVFDFT